MHINVCMHTLRFRRHCFIYISSWLQYNALHVLRKYWEKSVRSCMEMQVQHEAASITTIVAISNKYFLWATEIFSQWPYKSISCIIKIGWALITPKSSSSSPFGWNLALTKRTVFFIRNIKNGRYTIRKGKKNWVQFFMCQRKSKIMKKEMSSIPQIIIWLFNIFDGFPFSLFLLQWDPGQKMDARILYRP